VDSFKIKLILFTKKFFSSLRRGWFLYFNKRFKFNDFNKEELDKKLIYSLNKSKIPSFKQIKYIGKYLNKWERYILLISFLILIVSISFWSYFFYNNHLETAPKFGGKYIEGVIGAPKHINPLYSDTNNADSDIASLVFSSLFKKDKNGSLRQDLIDFYKIEDGGKKYFIKIKQNVVWHDNKKLNIDDVIFTINTIMNKSYESPLYGFLSGVEIEKIDDYSLNFVLKEPYSNFFELLTFGILPKHLWEQIPAESAFLAELNIAPVGSGPFKFKSILRSKNSGKINSYKLESFSDFYGDNSYIEEFVFKFFSDYNSLTLALNEDLIDGFIYFGHGVEDSLIAKNTLNQNVLKLTQANALFFNEKNNSILSEKKVRQALSLSVDRDNIVNKVFLGQARVINGPVLPESFAYKAQDDKIFDMAISEKLLATSSWEKKDISQEDINRYLEKKDEKEKFYPLDDLGVGSWLLKNEDEDSEESEVFLSFVLTVLDNQNNLSLVNILKEQWSKLGIKANIKVIKPNEMANILAEKDFEVLLYAQQLGLNPDPYVFWHSSQIGENGLNISGFNNEEADKLLSEARQNINIDFRKERYLKFQDIFKTEVPAIYLYAPNYYYVQKKQLNNFTTSNISNLSDRFSDVSGWYTETERKIVW